MSQIKFRPAIAALSFAIAAAGFGSAAHAAPSADAQSVQQDGKKPAPRGEERRGPDGRHGHHHGPRGHHGHGPQDFQGKRQAMMRDAILVPGLGPIGKPVVEALKLSDAQQKQVQAARDAQSALFKQMRESGKPRHGALAAQIESGKLDPHALLAERSKSREAFKPQFDEVQQKWLAVWDGLDQAQRDQVAQHLKERQAKFAEFKARHEARQQGGPDRKGPAPR